MDLFFNLLNSINSGIIYADDEHIVRYMDDSSRARFHGQDFVGKSLVNCHRDASVAKILDYYQQMKDGKLEEVFVRKTQQGNSYMKVVKDQDGRVIGYLERLEKQAAQPQTALKDNLYQKSAGIYDALLSVRSDAGDIAFYKKWIPTDANVLEMGCGTGRVGIELAKRGNRVVGIDLSKEMINVCNAKIVDRVQDFKGSMKTKHQDMQKLNLDEKFDVILFPYRVFQMLLSDKARRQCLERVRKHMKPETVVIIDLFDPIVGRFADKESFEISLTAHDAVQEMEITRVSSLERHFDKQQIISYKDCYEIKHDNGAIETYEEPMRLCYMHKEQATALFEDMGFKVEHLFGDYSEAVVDFKVPKELIYILN